MGKGKDGKRKVIPKRIAGYKLPKQLRRTGEALIAQTATPEGRAALTRGLGAAATLASVAADARRAAAPEKGRTAEQATPSAPLDPAKIAQAVGIVAQGVLGRLFTGGKA